MRKRFVELLDQYADDRTILLTGDLGYGLFDEYQKNHPLINCGITEQSMMGMATGLALSGWKVFVYSIANFPTLRCLEQIRNDVVQHQADVNIVMYGVGDTYKHQGWSHYATEDLEIMSHFDILIADPETENDFSKYMKDIFEHSGPSYLRLKKL